MRMERIRNRFSYVLIMGYLELEQVSQFNVVKYEYVLTICFNKGNSILHTFIGYG
jgi:hypothetical protein